MLLKTNEVIDKYGLTRTMIKKLGNPDDIEEYTSFHRRVICYYYDEEKVKDWIKNNQDLIKKSKTRKDGASKAINTKRENNKQRLENMINNIRMDDVNMKSLYKEAYNYYLHNSYNFSIPGVNGIIAYIRHNYTDYENILDFIKGKVGTNELYLKLRERLDKMINDKYLDKINTYLKETPRNELYSIYS